MPLVLTDSKTETKSEHVSQNSEACHKQDKERIIKPRQDIKEGKKVSSSSVSNDAKKNSQEPVKSLIPCLKNPVKRTASMPVYKFQPPADKNYTNNSNASTNGFVKHEGMPLTHAGNSSKQTKLMQWMQRATSPQRAPQLPPRNYQPHVNDTKLHNHHSNSSQRDSRTKSDAPSLQRKSMWNTAENPSSIPQPMDVLRQELRLQEKAKHRARSASPDKARYNGVSYYPEPSTLQHPSQREKLKSKEQASIHSNSQTLQNNTHFKNQSSEANLKINNQNSFEDKKHLTMNKSSVRFVGDPHSNSTALGQTLGAQITGVPQARQSVVDNVRVQSIAINKSFSSHLPSSQKSFASHEAEKNRTHVTNLQSSQSGDNMAAPSTNGIHNQSSIPTTGQNTLSKTQNIVRQKSNKYQTLVCPDFFPLSKINGLSRRKADEFHDIIAAEELPDSKPTHDGGFYTGLGGYRTIDRSMFTKLDDSYTEEPDGKFLYSSKASNKKSQPKPTEEFYFEVNLSQPSCSGDYSVSLSSTEIRRELSDSVNSSSNSGYYPDSEMSPPILPPKKSVERSRVSLSRQNELNNLGSGMSLYQTQEKLQYQTEEVEGQRGQTAVVLAHIEPSESDEGSSYSTVHVYRNPSQISLNSLSSGIPKRSPSKMPDQHNENRSTGSSLPQRVNQTNAIGSKQIPYRIPPKGFQQPPGPQSPSKTGTTLGSSLYASMNKPVSNTGGHTQDSHYATAFPTSDQLTIDVTPDYYCLEPDNEMAHSSPKQLSSSSSSEISQLKAAGSYRAPPVLPKRQVKSSNVHSNELEDRVNPSYRARYQEELNPNIETLTLETDGLGEGLSEDLQAILQLWKKLPNNGTAKDLSELSKDPLVDSLNEKVKTFSASKGQGLRYPSSRSQSQNAFKVQREPFHPVNAEPSFKVVPRELVAREPGEGSSDDLDDVNDNNIYKQNPINWMVKGQIGNNKSAIHNTPSIQQPANSSTHSIQQPANRISERKLLPSNHSHLKKPSDIERSQLPKPKPITAQTKKPDLFASTQEISDSEESEYTEASTRATPKDDGSDLSDDGTDGQDADSSCYLSDYQVRNNKNKQKSMLKKKISFSLGAKKPKPGEIIDTSPQHENLLSVNPLMASDEAREYMEELERKFTDYGYIDKSDSLHLSSDPEPSKPKPGILKKSEEFSGSQLSLGASSAFGSHASLDSTGSGMSRTGSFPLLTLSDGSKKDFRIRFDDTDVSQMGNLFKVTKKARSEGAASEPESTDSDSDDEAMPVMCKNCSAKQPLYKARLIYKMCHGCYTYYCSSECRRQDWSAHKPICIVSRLSSLARKIFKCVSTDYELLNYCSRFARTGYLCEGRGAVVFSFSSPRKAQLFLSNVKQAKETAVYMSIKDLQKFTFDDKRDKDQLLSNCKHYDPDEKFIFHLAIKMTKSSSSDMVEPRIRGREFHKWARIRLSEKLNTIKREAVDEEDTLILTAITNTTDESLSRQIPDQKMREVFFASVISKLRKRGVSLRHQYPDVYSILCQYVLSGKLFSPICLFAFNLHTQKRFMCCIMPYSDSDVTWTNSNSLIKNLELTATL